MIRLLRWLWAPIWAEIRGPVNWLVTWIWRLLHVATALWLLSTTALWATGMSRAQAFLSDATSAETVHIELGRAPSWMTVEIRVRQPQTGADACPPPRSHGHDHTPCELGDTGPAARIEPVADGEETER